MAGIEDLRKGSFGQRMRFLLKDSVTYGGASGFSRVFSIFTVPILTRIFTVEDYGVIDAILVFGMMFMPMIMFGLTSSVARYFYETEDEHERVQIITQAFLVQTLLSIIMVYSLYSSSEYLIGKFLGYPEYELEFRIVILSQPFIAYTYFFQNILKWTFQRKKFLILTLGSTSSVVLLTLFYVAFLKMGIRGAFYAQLTGMSIFAILGLIFCIKWIALPRDTKYIIPMLKYGWPYMLIMLSNKILPSIDRYFIGNYLNLNALGIWAVAYKISRLLIIPMSGFQTAWGPFAYSIYKEENAGETYNNVLRYYLIIISLISLLLIITVKPLILLFASQKYLNSIPYVFPLTFALLIESISNITGIGIGLSKRTYFSALSYGLGILASIIALFFLVKPFGLIGVAIGVIIGKITLTASLTVFGYIAYPIRFNINYVVKLLSIWLFFSFLTQVFRNESILIVIGISIMTLGSFIVIIWRSFIEQNDKEKIKSLLQRKLPLRSRS